MIENDIRIAGRGFIFITIAKVYFLITSAIVNIGLPRLFGDPAKFGDFRVVNSFLSVLTMVIITGTIQAISKITSEDIKRAEFVKNKGLIMHSFIGLPLSLFIFILSDFISFKILNDEKLGLYLEISSSIILFYSFYAVFIGIFNGLKEFHKQSGLDITFSTLKTVLIITFVLAGMSVKGAFTGFAFAAFIILVIAIFIYQKGKIKSIYSHIGKDVSFKKISAYIFPIMLYTLFLNLLLQIDVLVLKSTSFSPVAKHFDSLPGEWRLTVIFKEIGIENISENMKKVFSTQVTSRLSGIYGAVKNVAILPYQGIISLVLVVFPFISSSTYRGDISRTRTEISQTMRFALILSLFMISALISEPEGIISLLFGKQYLSGGLAMTLLLVSTVFFALLYVSNSIITGGGSPQISLLICAITFISSFLSLIVFLEGKISDTQIINNTSIAMLFSMIFGFLLSAGVVLKKYKVIFPFRTLLRCIFAVVIIYIFGIFLSVEGIFFVLLKCMFSAILFFGILIVSGEIKKNDMDSLKKIFRKG